MRFLVLTLLLLGSVFARPAEAETTITVVADEWPPFSGETLPNKGLSIDVITTVLERAGYSVQSEILPWGRIMDGARRGEYDIIGSLFLDEELQQFMTYSRPYFETRVKFVRRVGKTHTYSDLNSLRPYKIAVGEGFLYESGFDAADYLDKLSVTTTLQGLRMVAANRVDLTLDSEHVIEFLLQSDAPELTSLIEFIEPPIASREIHMAVRNSLPNQDKVVADFNEELQNLIDDGSLQQLLKRHVAQ